MVVFTCHSKSIWRTSYVLNNLTKRDLTIRISEETGLVQKKVQIVIQCLMDHLLQSLSSGQKKIALRKFGTFEVRMRKARIGRNPHLPEHDIPIPARAVVKFKAGKEMRAKLEKLMLS